MKFTLEELLKHKEVDLEERDAFLENHPFPLPNIKLEFLHRAVEDQVSLIQLEKLVKYICSNSAFNEIESLFFYHFLDGTDAWQKGLDHIYKRSITPIHEMN